MDRKVLSLRDMALGLWQEAQSELIISKEFEMAAYVLYSNGVYGRLNIPACGGNKSQYLSLGVRKAAEKAINDVMVSHPPAATFVLAVLQINAGQALTGCFDSPTERFNFIRPFECRGYDIVLGEFVDSSEDPKWLMTELFGMRIFDHCREEEDYTGIGVRNRWNM